MNNDDQKIVWKKGNNRKNQDTFQSNDQKSNDNSVFGEDPIMDLSKRYSDRNGTQEINQKENINDSISNIQSEIKEAFKETSVNFAGEKIEPNQSKTELNVDTNKTTVENPVDKETENLLLEKEKKKGVQKTYYTDLSKAMGSNEPATVSELLRKDRFVQKEKEIFSPRSKKNIAYIASSVLLIIGIIGMFTIVFNKKDAVRYITDKSVSSLVYSDFNTGINTVDVEPEKTKQAIRKVVETELREDTIHQIYYVNKDSFDNLRRSGIKQVFESTDNLPPELLYENIENDFMHGVYRTDKNHPFIILKALSYDRAFLGMKQWETTMIDDLSTYFDLPKEAGDRSLLEPGFSDDLIKNKTVRVARFLPRDVDRKGNIFDIFGSVQEKNKIILAINKITSFVNEKISNYVINSAEYVYAQINFETQPEIIGSEENEYICYKREKECFYKYMKNDDGTDDPRSGKPAPYTPGSKDILCSDIINVNDIPIKKGDSLYLTAINDTTTEYSCQLILENAGAISGGDELCSKESATLQDQIALDDCLNLNDLSNNPDPQICDSQYILEYEDCIDGIDGSTDEESLDLLEICYQTFENNEFVYNLCLEENSNFESDYDLGVSACYAQVGVCRPINIAGEIQLNTNISDIFENNGGLRQKAAGIAMELKTLSLLLDLVGIDGAADTMNDASQFFFKIAFGNILENEIARESLGIVRRLDTLLIYIDRDGELSADSNGNITTIGRLRNIIDLIKSTFGFSHNTAWATLGNSFPNGIQLPQGNSYTDGSSETSEQVIEPIQQVLVLIGLMDPISVTGQLDLVTQDAISSLQYLNGITQTGELDTVTINLINNVLSGNGSLYDGADTASVDDYFDGFMGISEYSEYVQSLQILLYAEGYEIDDIDGLYDQQVCEAVRSYQYDNELDVSVWESCSLTAETIDSLNNLIRSGGYLGTGFSLTGNGSLEGFGVLEGTFGPGTIDFGVNSADADHLNKGDIVLMYAFLDEKTILITRHESVITEIIKRRAFNDIFNKD